MTSASAGVARRIMAFMDGCAGRPGAASNEGRRPARVNAGQNERRGEEDTLTGGVESALSEASVIAAIKNPQALAGNSGAFSAARVYWTAFIGLSFDYYDLYLFV